MAKMEIQLYKGVLKNARKLLVECQNLANGTDLNGLELPMIFYKDIQEQKSELNQYIGKLNLVIETLSNDSNKNYRNILQELKQVEIQLSEVEKIFLNTP